MFTKPIDRGYILECQGTENKYKVILRRQGEKRTIGVIDHIKNEWTTNRREQHIVLYDGTIGFNKYLIDTLPSDMNVKIGKSKVAIQILREKGRTRPLVDYKYDQQRFVPARLFNL